MTTRDNRFGSQTLAASTISSLIPVSDIGGSAKYLRYLQIEKTTAGTLTSPGQAYLNVYNTGEVTVSTTEPVLRIPYPVIDSAKTPYAMVIPFGYYFDTSISFSITEKDKTLLGESGAASSPSMTVRVVIS